ncbi:MAG TPA: PhzF family phenazine biosynthesis protein [Streptosporangiaceae bacterium]|jgi:trans-2,3-dihydro-3-hydroxyanthranilate isomerase
MSLAYVIVDVFTDTPLQGNQLAVFEDGSALSDDQMQRLAREMNLSETVFLLPAEDGGDARMRIFTPAAELPFAGHPVLGTAFVVGEARQLTSVQLETAAAAVPLKLTRSRQHGGSADDIGQITFAWMRQPIPARAPFPRTAQLLAALGVPASGLPVESYTNGPTHVYVALPDEAAVTALKPHITALAGFAGASAYCFAGSGRHWRSRMFAPAAPGVTEDPATGSAAGPLAIHLARHGRIGFGEEIEIRQGAEVGRPSVLHARVNGSPAGIESVEVGGAAVIVARGEFRRW